MFLFRLLTPDRILFEQEVSSVSLPTEQGQITVLDHHVPLTSVLVAGVLHLKEAGEKEEEIAVSGGFIQVGSDGRVTVLANTAERGEELELSVIEEARLRAQEAMQQTIGRDDVAFAAAAAALERETARHHVATRHHQKHRSPPLDPR